MKKLDVISAYKLGLDALGDKRYNGFIGVSPGYPFFSNTNIRNYCEQYFDSKHLDAYARWASENFSKFLFFVGDYLLHYNIMAFSNRDRDTALVESDYVGKIFAEKIKKIIGENDTLCFSNWEIIAEKQDFQDLLGIVRDYARTNEKFRQRCIELTLAGTRNKMHFVKQKFGRKSYKRALSIAKQYSVDDVAIMLYCYKDWPVSVSKYDLPYVLKSICESDYPDLSEKLRLPDKTGHIQIAPAFEPVYNEFYDNDFEVLLDDAP